MHLEVLVEDSSGKKLLEILLPKFLGQPGEPHTWRVHPYKGIGKIPKGLKPTTHPRKRILLDQLPRVIEGLGKSPGIDAVVVVLDSDREDCSAFLQQLLKLVESKCPSAPTTMFRIAIEEMEAWYFGDQDAILSAYPKARREVLNSYQQDSVCGTWERLADAIHPGGSQAVRKAGWPLPGQLKHEWAGHIGPFMDIEANASPSFEKLREGLAKLVTRPEGR